jgi:hypothetical protein
MKSFMLRIGWLMLGLVFFLPAYAGPVYGKLTANGKPASNITITITRNNETYSATTGRDGSYNIQVNGTGRYVLKLTYTNQEVIYTIFSYSRAIRYDLDLQQINGRYSLRRK